jgi:hypothetical protein
MKTNSFESRLKLTKTNKSIDQICSKIALDPEERSKFLLDSMFPKYRKTSEICSPPVFFCVAAVVAGAWVVVAAVAAVGAGAWAWAGCAYEWGGCYNFIGVDNSNFANMV